MTQPLSDAPTPRTTAPAVTGDRRRAFAIGLLKAAVLVAVVGFVGQAATDAWRDLREARLRIDPIAAAAAAIIALAAYAPMAWFWRRVLVTLDQPAPGAASWRAYYVSQLGKYVPGKATVVIIRTERLLNAVRMRDPSSGSKRLVAAAVFYETLVHMAAGSLLAAVLLAAPNASGGSAASPALIGLACVLAVACVAPTTPAVFAWLLRRLLAKPRPRLAAADEIARRLGWRQLGTGGVASLVSWCGNGVGVWLAALAVGAVPFAWPTQPGLWPLAAALPIVAGFVSLLPAGVVVREGLLLTLLAPSLGDGPALATTLVWRLASVAAETLGCGGLLILDASRRRSPVSTD